MTYITQLTGRKAMFSSRILTMMLASFVLVVLQSSTVQAQWSNGTNINNTNSGTVSVGTTNPGGDKLIIAGNTIGGNITSHTQLHSTYDSQANVIMELGYGTATANITPYPSIVLSKNLTSTNNFLGAFQFANRSIANGSEKRIASIAAWTDGATNSGALLFNTSNAGALAERMRINSAGNVGIGTATPSSALDVAGISRSQAFNLNGFSAEKAFTTLWSNGVANQKVQVYWPASTQVDGIYEITVTGHYWYSNSNGGIRKRIVINGRNVGIINMEESEVPFRLGFTGNSDTISNIMWDAANSRYYFIVSNLDNAQNAITIHVKSITPGATPANADNLNITPIYTTDPTSYPQLFTSFMSSNVGVGTNTPAYKLDVQGGSLNASGGLCIAGDCKTAWSQVGGGSSQWTTAGSNIYYNSGNVGVGTTSPVFDANVARYLTVDGGSGVIGSIGAAGGTGSAATAVSQVAFINSSLGTTDKRLATIVGSTDAATNSGVLDFYTASSGAFSIPKLRITSGGNIGIGTMSPGYRLDVQGGSLNASGGLCIAGDCKTAWSQVGSSQWTTNGSNVYYNTGNVGLGTTTPGAKLDVAGTVRSGNADTNFGNHPTYGTTYSGFWRQGADYSLLTEGSNTFLNAPAAAGNIYFRSANANKMVVQGSNGNVGIGTATPSSKLHVVSGTDTGTTLLSLDTGVHGGTSMVVYGTVNNESGFDMSVYRAGQYFSRFGVTNYGNVYMQSGGGSVGIGTSTPDSNYKLDVNGATNVTGNLNASGTITGGNIVAKYQDVAEWVQSSQELAAGTVVVLDPTKSNQVIASFQAYDTRVAGVISSQPGITLGENGAGKVLVATTGRVRIKVDASLGSIQVGDLLVTSDVAGVAMKSQPINVGGFQIHRPGTLIGKALEPLAKGTGEILVLLSLQ